MSAGYVACTIYHIKTKLKTMYRRTKNRVKRLIRESMEEVLNQEYRTKKNPEPVEEPEPEPEWMKGLEVTMDDVKAMFDQGPKYDDSKAGGDYEIDNENPVFYVNGKEITADSISPFHNDFAIVKCNGQQGFIDKNGELLGGKFYTRCDDFEDGWGLVVDETGKRNYVNARGEYLLPNWVTRASSFMNGEAMVMDNGNRYKIDTQGNVIN